MPSRTDSPSQRLPAVRAATAALAVIAVIAVIAASAAGATGSVSGTTTNESGFWSAGGTSLRLPAEPSARTGEVRETDGGAAAGRAYRLATRGGEREVRLPTGVEIEELFALKQGAFLSARDARRDLYLALIDRDGLHALPAPRMGVRQVRENAVPLASTGGDLAGLVWLEGADRQSYSVRYAAWDTLRWTEPEEVAGEAPGSQLALAAATLGDGSTLLVWSRFDGQDDEIVAARYENGRWGEARPIADDNSVPDITPAVVAVPGGALATWSRYDGHDYRVVIARFDGRKWSPPSWAGAAGSTEPYLTPLPPVTPVSGQEPGPEPGSPSGGKPATWLTFASAEPRGWGVLELDATGRVLRRGSVGNAPTARPALEPLPSGEVRLRWAALESDVELH